MTESHRLFVAVSIPKPIKSGIADWCSPIARELPFRKWTHPEDLHITLQFLGNTETDRLDQVSRKLAAVVALHEGPALSLTIESLGTFGRPTTPAILWAGIGGEGAVPLHGIQRRVADAMKSIGFAPDNRPFHPHLTVAREYRGETPLQAEALERFGSPADPRGRPFVWEAADIMLYRSHLNRKPMYEPLARFPLGQARGG
ncbi:RNA 2',3'-cyclic phosphodiesterase [Paenibacillus methanolicus]|uniref:RNA 2',3'-cyclic phosphodiesterase n=1 Tax=Paenibacillus methanolicus TaxID=582686 RepID=A0A5S5BV04_9BACL|nr:RNA 2',3'-cyclic phosphodiesterase [Paenibacillus methanolicus]TYP70784.1 2'-5' RNA ligase [Paenibacillus methanolicus]